MNITETPISLLEVAGVENNHRDSGWHVTNLIEASDRLAKGLPTNPRWFRDPPEPEVPEGLFEWGFLWESVARDWFWNTRLTEEIAFNSHPDQHEKDGIIGNADGVIFHGGDAQAIVECKLRFSRNEELLDRWLQQTKAYCAIWETNRVYFLIGHIHSNPPGGKARLVTVDFTDQEIQENWTMLLNTKNHLERLLAG